MRRRRILGLGLAAAAVALTLASTAYACVVITGDGTVAGTAKTSNLMTGLGTGHGYCAGDGPVTSAAGPAGSRVDFTFAPSTDANCPGQMSAGTYDVRLRNTTAGYTGGDPPGGSGWTQTLNSGCFHPSNVGAANNYDLGNLTVPTSGSGSGNWNLPGTGLTTNGANDASIFCVGKFGPNGEAPTGTSDGFLAPFRVVTV